MLQCQGNRIIFDPDVRGNHDLFHEYFSSISEKYNVILLDLERVEYIDPSFMLPLIGRVLHSRNFGKDIRAKYPTEGKMGRLFVNSNWAHLLDRSQPSGNRRILTQLPAMQFKTPDEHFDVINLIMEKLHQTVETDDRDLMYALEWSINEITDNILNHADSDIGGIVQVNNFKTKKQVAIYVIDSGIGISATLRTASSYTDDVAALRDAVNEGVTRNKITNQGNGLYGTRKCCQISGGSLFIRTNRAKLYLLEDTIQASRMTTNYVGTYICAKINYDVKDLLPRALVFNGKPHSNGFDFISQKFITDSGSVNIKMKEFSPGFGSRRYGEMARLQIEKMYDAETRINCDFHDISVISSSYADELFGKLAKKYGVSKFGNLFSFQNITEETKSIINLAIRKRVDS